jgi:predicted Zn finger-like uncharacterized protein
MDVTCPRCQTDYEFDDALVSERGTTVKCTNCGHQFRVYRPRATGATAAPEVWRIERAGGDAFELRSLIELQRAIRAGRVSREDRLRRGDAPARLVGEIPELEPFFPAPRAEGAPSTLPLPSAIPPVVEAIVDPAPPPRPPAATPAYGAPAAQDPEAKPPARGSRRRVQTAPMPVIADRLPPASARPPERSPDPTDPSSAPSAERAREQRQGSADARAPREPPRRPARRIETAEIATERSSRTSTPGPAHGVDTYEALFEGRAQRRGSKTTWIALLLVASAGAAAATVGRPWIARLLDRRAPAANDAGARERLDRELAAGDRARAEGDFASAHEAYVRATALDDRSLPAWDGLCTADTERAMTHWISALVGRSALERTEAANVGAAAGRACQRWAELARAEPDGARRVGLDLRPVRASAAQGDLKAFSIHVAAHPGDPIVEALGLLAGAADDPTGSPRSEAAATALARVTPSAAVAPSDLALSAYGAAVFGMTARAQEALDELERRTPRYVLLETLRSFLARADAGVPDAARAEAGRADLPAMDGGALSNAFGDAATGATGGDYRSLNERGHQALASGEVAKAEGFFRAALAQKPGDIDAHYGLGQIARSRGDRPQAVNHFKLVLDQSPGFSAARLALADEQWASGDRTGAAQNYALYLERVTEGPGAERARERTGKGRPEPAEPEKAAPKPESAKPESGKPESGKAESGKSDPRAEETP